MFDSFASRAVVFLTAVEASELINSICFKPWLWSSEIVYLTIILGLTARISDL